MDKCDRCKQPKDDHPTAMINLAENPFGRAQITYVLICPTALYKHDVKPEQKTKTEKPPI